MRTTGGRRGRLPAAVVLLCGLLVLGAVAVALSIATERRHAKERDDNAAELVASHIAGQLERSVAAFRGAGALGVDGEVTAAEFEAYAKDVINDSLFTAVAYERIVDDGDLAALEAETGVTPRDSDGRGGFVAVASRPRHLVVVRGYPAEQTNALLGFDIASDPVHLAAAQASERNDAPAIADPVTLANSAAPGLFVIHEIRGADGTAIGFVSSSLGIDQLVNALGSTAPDVELGLRLEETVLVSSDDGGAVRSFDIAGRTFVVTADDGAGPEALIPTLIVIGTLLVAIAAIASYRRDRRLIGDQRRVADRNRAIAELGRTLAGATEPDDVVRAITNHAGGIIGSRYTNLARRSAADPSKVEVARDVGMDDTVAHEFAMQSLDESLPVTDCVRTGETLVIRSDGDYRRRYPQVIHEVRTAGIYAVVCVPLEFSDDVCIGAIEFAFGEALGLEQADDLVVAATTIAQLGSRALERSTVADAARSHAAHLSTLAQALAAAPTVDAAAQVIERLVPRVVGCSAASLTTVDPSRDGDGVDDGRIIGRDLNGTRGERLGRLELSWDTPVSLTTTQHAVLMTVTGLVSRTLEQTARAEQEHELIVQLQRDLLAAPPDVESLEIAVRYQPAMTIVGLGGDWYDIIASSGGRTYVVIGDITGHGSSAVTAMADVKAVMNHLLRLDTPLDVVCQHADSLLARHGTYATAQIVAIDGATGGAEYVNAGHPFPVVRRSDGAAEELRDGHRALLGAGQTGPITAGRLTLQPDEVLLLYTDGLIERRTDSLDVHMRRLASMLERAEGNDLGELVDQLLEAERAEQSAERVDDDIAIVAVRRTA
ncbi:MAG: SpoIIE family protein phosphatase [Acidimicrobiia bacterium]|nr:SpoIIE family protein phosphatase [Acidimicrobiia bacterium]